MADLLQSNVNKFQWEKQICVEVFPTQISMFYILR